MRLFLLQDSEIKLSKYINNPNIKIFSLSNDDIVTWLNVISIYLGVYHKDMSELNCCSTLAAQPTLLYSTHKILDALNSSMSLTPTYKSWF
jgi:hypothetical protein